MLHHLNLWLPLYLKLWLLLPYLMGLHPLPLLNVHITLLLSKLSLLLKITPMRLSCKQSIADRC